MDHAKSLEKERIQQEMLSPRVLWGNLEHSLIIITNRKYLNKRQVKKVFSMWRSEKLVQKADLDFSV